MTFFGNLFSKKDNKNLILRPNQYIQLTDDNENMSGALLMHDNDTKNKLIKYFRSSQDNNLSGHNGHISDTIIDKLGAAGSIVASGLQAGNLMQIVGTPALMEGIKTGTYAMMSTAVGTTGTVVSSTTGQIVGQLRFQPANIAPILAPMAIWQIMNAIAGAHQLAKINARLDSLQRSIENIIFRFQANAYGRLFGAITSLNEIDKQFQTIGYFTDDMSVRLAIATQEIHIVFHEHKVLIDRFTEKSQNIIDSTEKKIGATYANTLLKEECPNFLIDANIYTNAAKAAFLSSKLWLMHDLHKVPEYVSYRNETIKNEVQQVENTLRVFSVIEELKEHSEKCLYEMDWFSRNIFNRELRNEIQSREEEKHSEIENIDKDETEPTLLIYKDDNQKINCINLDSKVE
jgi:hypothetical protein